MAAGRYSFTIEQGSTLNLELQYKDSNNIPIDLSNYGGRMQIRPTIESSEIIISLSSSLLPDGTGLNFSGSNNVTPPESGSIGIYISAISSSLFNFSEAVYDLEIYSGDVVNRILEGKVTLSKEVTR
jgi:hypothetical protein